MSDQPSIRPKRSWPLLVLGASAFIPGLGFLLGTAAVTWGLVSNRPRAKWGVILGGLGAFANIVFAIVISVRTPVSPSIRRAQAEGARHDLSELVMELERYRGRTGRYPSTLHELLYYQTMHFHFTKIYDQTGSSFFVHVYQYRLAADGSSYDLFAAGPDDKPDTPDDVRPSLPDSVLAHTGYRPGTPVR